MHLPKCLRSKLASLIFQRNANWNNHTIPNFITWDRRNKHTVANLFQPLTHVPKGSIVKVPVDGMTLSHKLMLDCGIIRLANPGTFHYLPLGMRSLDKLIKLVSFEMNAIGCQKIELSTLISRELWKRTGRWEEMGEELFTLIDRQNRHLCLGPTHEESITEIISSLPPMTYKSLPLKLYQISKKYRDEMRPRAGLLRSREFIMKDLYCFETGEDVAKITYDVVGSAYENLFHKLGLPFKKVLGDSGAMGGSLSHEYHICADSGEDKISFCSSCNYGANIEVLGDSKDLTCPVCKSQLEQRLGIEVGHTFMLGTKYSNPLNALFTNASGTMAHVYMSCFGLGVSRILAAALETQSTLAQLRWPSLIAPYQICIITPKSGSKEESGKEMANHLYNALNQNDMFPDDVIFDDRPNMTIGQRMIEAKRTGYPYIIVVGKKVLETVPLIEVYDSSNQSTQHVTHKELFNYFRNRKLN